MESESGGDGPRPTAGDRDGKLPAVPASILGYEW